MDITKLSDQELKALAYDLILQRDNVIQNLNVINQELKNRANAPQAKFPPKEPEPKEDKKSPDKT